MSAAKIVKGATEALAIARGEKPAAAVYHNGLRYVPEAELQRWQSIARDRLRTLKAERKARGE